MLHEAVKVGRDENGIFLTIKFTKDMIDKVYLEEIFDDYAEAEELIDISVKTHSSGSSRLRPPALYESLDPKEITRVKEDLDLRPVYRPLRDDLNVFKQLTRLLEENP
ncbi:hypothetical protein GF325_15045, partial [Candidatus Bathyarchaeota archaeon]|nr:hypothetical protein [Candidatus Bathyarchaeota archaeon]